MPLFSQKIIDKHTKHVLYVDYRHIEILNSWAKNVEQGIYDKETQNDGEFIQKILIEVLGYIGSSHGEEWSVAKNQPLGKGNVDVALGEFTKSTQKVTAPFELKGAKTKDLDAIMSGRNKSPVQQAWEYAMDAKGAKWVLVSNYREIRLYAVGYGRKEYERFDLTTLNQPTNYARFMLLLSAKNLMGGTTESLLKESEKAGKDITNRLYMDYRILRENVINSLKENNSQIDKIKIISYAQIILDRILFIAFSEDRGLLPEHTLEKAFQHQDIYNPKPIWENFKGLFNYVDKGNPHLGIPAYNGGLFSPDIIPENLIVADSLCEGFKKLGEYDFESEVGVTVLGHIFEQSITDIELLQADASTSNKAKEKSTTGKRKKEGVVYTPDSLTRFIVDETLGAYIKDFFNSSILKYLKKSTNIDLEKDDLTLFWKNNTAELTFWEEYQNRLRTLRIVDPACGSGAFLVAAFDFLQAEYTRVNERLAVLKGGTADLFDLDKEILSHNLYGVDINSESIEITKLSLWLKTAKRGKPLNSLDHTVCVGNSIINNEDPTQGFDWKVAFPEVFIQGGFDIVLGNPPYVRQELLTDIKPYLKLNYSCYHGVADLYVYFYELALGLLRDGGRIGYISSGTFFKTNSGRALRQHLLKHVKFICIINFGDLQVFEGVTTYPVITVMEKKTPVINDTFKFLDLKKLPQPDLSTEYASSASSMRQNYLMPEGWNLGEISAINLREKLFNGKGLLKDVYTSPLYGVKTGFNDAFIITKDTRDQLLMKDAKSIELIKPFLEGKDIKNWHTEPRDIFLIFARRGIDINLYPAIKQHLEKFKDQLQPKPKDWEPSEEVKEWTGRKSGSYNWFEIQDAVDYYAKFDVPKIVYAHFSPEALFSLDSNGYYSNDKSYIIPDAEWYLVGLLNSKLQWFIIKSLCPYVRGGFYELRIQYIETLPIAYPEKAKRDKIGMMAHQCQTASEEIYRLSKMFLELVMLDFKIGQVSQKLDKWYNNDYATFISELKKKKINISLSKKSEWLELFEQKKSQILTIKNSISNLEYNIDQQIYELYDLTPSEIKIIEDSHNSHQVKN